MFVDARGAHSDIAGRKTGTNVCCHGRGWSFVTENKDRRRWSRRTINNPVLSRVPLIGVDISERCEAIAVRALRVRIKVPFNLYKSTLRPPPLKGLLIHNLLSAVPSSSCCGRAGRTGIERDRLSGRDAKDDGRRDERVGDACETGF